MDHGIDIGDRREKPEEDHGSSVRDGIRGARLVVVDVCGVGNDRRAHTGRVLDQTLFIRGAAHIDAVGIAVAPNSSCRNLRQLAPA